MILFPSLSIASAQKGIALWADVVLPALLPFFICANFMIALDIPLKIGGYFETLFRRIFNAPGSSAFVFIISITSGYPMGAKLIGDLHRLGEITRVEAMRMLCFCSTSGPLFLLGTVGVGMLHSTRAGALIAVSHYLGAIANGLFFRMLDRNSSLPVKHKAQDINRSNRLQEPYRMNDSILDLLTDSILSAMKTLCIICCYLILFNMITDLIDHIGVFDRIQQPYLIGFLKGLLEMTIGCNEIAVSQSLSLEQNCVLISGLISFGGISIFAQSMSVLRGLFISPAYYFAVKIMHGIFAAIFTLLLANTILNGTIAVGGFETAAHTFEPGYFAQLLFSTRMIIIIMVIFAITLLAGKQTNGEDNHKK